MAQILQNSHKWLENGPERLITAITKFKMAIAGAEITSELADHCIKSQIQKSQSELNTIWIRQLKGRHIPSLWCKTEQWDQVDRQHLHWDQGFISTVSSQNVGSSKANYSSHFKKQVHHAAFSRRRLKAHSVEKLLLFLLQPKHAFIIILFSEDALLFCRLFHIYGLSYFAAAWREGEEGGREESELTCSICLATNVWCFCFISVLVDTKSMRTADWETSFPSCHLSAPQCPHGKLFCSHLNCKSHVNHM